MRILFLSSIVFTACSGQIETSLDSGVTNVVLDAISGDADAAVNAGENPDAGETPDVLSINTVDAGGLFDGLVCDPNNGCADAPAPASVVCDYDTPLECSITVQAPCACGAITCEPGHLTCVPGFYACFCIQ